MTKEFFNRFALAAGAVLVCAAVIDVTWLHYGLVGGDEIDFGIGVSICACVVWYCRWAKNDKLMQGCALILCTLFLARLLVFPVFMAARSGMPLCDNTFARIDHAIGLEVPTVIGLMLRHPFVNTLLTGVYSSLYPLMLAAVLVPPLCGRLSEGRRYLTRITLALTIGSVVFALWPALGPWTAYSIIRPSPIQLQTSDTLLLLRGQAPLVMTRLHDGGLVCFPSFHTVFAVLSAICLGSTFKWMRVPAAILAGLICISTVTTGWHYISDVLGGLVLSLGAYGLSTLLPLRCMKVSNNQ